MVAHAACFSLAGVRSFECGVSEMNYSLCIGEGHTISGGIVPRKDDTQTCLTTTATHVHVFHYSESVATTGKKKSHKVASQLQAGNIIFCDDRGDKQRSR